MSAITTENKGMFFSSPQAKWMWMGRQTIIVGKNGQSTNEALYIMDKNYVYGIARLHPPNEITRQQFDERKNLHLINDADAEELWKGNSSLFEHSFDWIQRFEEPRRWNFKEPSDGFVENFEFLNAESVHSVEIYDPSKVSAIMLIDDWHIVASWYATFKLSDGSDTRHSQESIIETARRIYGEINKRVSEGTLDYKFNVSNMSDYTRELYNLISKQSCPTCGKTANNSQNPPKESSSNSTNFKSINAIVVSKSPRDGNSFEYLLAIPAFGEKIIPRKTIELDGRRMMLLGYVPSKEVIPIGSVVKVHAGEIKLHETDNGIYFTLSNTKMQGKVNESPTITDVLSGFFDSKTVYKMHSDEGCELPTHDIPKRMVNNLGKIMNSRVWMPFVIHMHSGGNPHRDFRLFVPNKSYGKILSYSSAETLFDSGKLSGIIEGFILSGRDNNVPKIDNADNVSGHVKLAHPLDWLFFGGVFNNFDSTDILNIIGHGIYTVRRVNDRFVSLELRSDKGSNLIQLNGDYTFRVSPDNNELTFSKIGGINREPDIVPSQIESIINLRSEYSLSQLAELTGIHRSTVSRYLTKFQ